MQFPQHPGQFLRRYVTQRRIREYPVEVGSRQLQREEILLEHFAAAVHAGQFRKLRRAFEPCRDMPELRERLQIASRTAVEIQIKGGVAG